MANVLNEEKKQQVLALGRLGWSLRRIQQATHVRRETASAYLKAAGIGVRPPSGWGRCEPKPANEVITDSGAAKSAIPVILDPNCNPNPKNLSNKGKARATSKPANENEVITDSAMVTSPSACELYREAIDLGLSRGRNAMAIWQDLVSEYGFASSYQSVQRFVRKRRGTQTPEARVVIVTAAGQEAQVDYGTGPMVRDPESRKYRRTRLFVMTLGCSRKSVRLLTFRSSSRIWAELHERAFRRLGGATRIVVLDNLREGVLVPDIYDPTLNPLYRDVLAHYGAVAMPCRIQDPDRKGKVESGVGRAENTAERLALRDSGRSPSSSRSLGATLGRHAHPRHHQTAGRRHVCRRETHIVTAAAGAVPLLPVRRAHRASGWLRRGRGRLLRRTARLDRARATRAMG